MFAFIFHRKIYIHTMLESSIHNMVIGYGFNESLWDFKPLYVLHICIYINNYAFILYVFGVVVAFLSKDIYYVFCFVFIRYTNFDIYSLYYIIIHNMRIRVSHECMEMWKVKFKSIIVQNWEHSLVVCLGYSKLGKQIKAKVMSQMKLCQHQHCLVAAAKWPGISFLLSTTSFDSSIKNSLWFCDDTLSVTTFFCARFFLSLMQFQLSRTKVLQQKQ